MDGSGEKAPFEVLEECRAALMTARGKEKGPVYERMGDAYLALSKGSKALICYQEAYDAGNNDVGFLEKFSTQLANSGKGREAEELMGKALERATTTLDKARLLNQSSYVSRHTGRFDDGIKAASKALEMMSNLDEGDEEAVRVMAQSNTMMGLNHWRKGDVDEATGLFETALELFKKVGDRKGMGATLNHLGVMASLRGEPEKALELYKRSLENADVSRTHNNIALSLKVLGEFDEAEKAFKETIKMARNEGNKVGIHITQLNLANLSLEKGDMVKARAWVDMSSHGFQEMGGQSMTSLMLETRARVSLMEGDPKGAKEEATRALELAQSTKEKEYEANAIVVFGLIAKKEGRLERAKDHLLHGIRMMEDNNILRYLGENYMELALVERELGLEGESRKAAAEARRYLEKQGARYRLGRMDELGL